MYGYVNEFWWILVGVRNVGQVGWNPGVLVIEGVRMIDGQRSHNQMANCVGGSDRKRE